MFKKIYSIIYSLIFVFSNIELTAQVEISLPFNTSIVSDDLDSAQNLIGGFDQDSDDDRCLVIRWRFSRIEMLDVHIYIENVETNDIYYLGRTANGKVDYFEWRKGNLNLNPLFADGPQFGESYTFIVFGLIDKDNERQTLYTFVPVKYVRNDYIISDISLHPNIPINTIIATDDQSNFDSLNYKTDIDSEENKQISIWWNVDDGVYEDFHVYLRQQSIPEYSTSVPGEYIGRTGSGLIKEFHWHSEKGFNRLQAYEFNDGPEFNSVYEFFVFGIKHPYGFDLINSAGPILYQKDNLVPTPTPTKSNFPNEISLPINGLDHDLVQLEMIWVEPGEFYMGSPLSVSFGNWLGPVQYVHITHGFYMSKYEITDAQWQSIMGWDLKYEYYPNSSRQFLWDDVQQFIIKLNEFSRIKFRLPTEAEWEYVCRAGTNTLYSYGDVLDCFEYSSDNPACSIHDLYINRTGIGYYPQIRPVGQKLPNPWGFYDMHGNFSEWVQDFFTVYNNDSAPVIDPQGPIEGTSQIRRGGRSANRPSTYSQGDFHYYSAKASIRLVAEVEQIEDLDITFENFSSAIFNTPTVTPTPTNTKTPRPTWTLRPTFTPIQSETQIEIPFIAPNFTPTKNL